MFKQMHSPDRLNDGPPQAVLKIIQFMDEALRSPDPLVRELVGVSFTENFDIHDSAYPELKSLLTGRLREDLEQMYP